MTDVEYPEIEAGIRALRAPLSSSVRAKVVGKDTGVKERSWFSLGVAVGVPVVVVAVLLASVARLLPGGAPAKPGVQASASLSLAAAASVFYVVESVRTPGSQPASSLTAVSWDGRRVGQVKVPATGDFRAIAPDGSMIITSLGDIISRDGLTVRHLDFDKTVVQAVWADDSRHLCLIMLDGLGKQRLAYGETAGGEHVIGAVGGAADHVYIGACSSRNQRAVTANWTSGTHQVWDLARGAVVRQYADSGGMAIVSSDALWEAQVDTRTGTKGITVTSPLHVVALDSGTQVAALPRALPQGFSSDGNRLVMIANPDTGGRGQTQVVDWRSGRVLWTAPGQTAISGATWSDPVSGDLLLNLLTGTRLELVIVNAQGQSIVASVSGNPTVSSAITNQRLVVNGG